MKPDDRTDLRSEMSLGNTEFQH